jgi:iron complex transport system ATP-binding protein
LIQLLQHEGKYGPQVDTATAFALHGVAVWRWDADVGVRRPILDRIDWQARAGELWALLGPNGAGKTTLLTVLGAVEFPSTGSVDVLGERLGRTDVFRLRERIGFVDARLGRRFAPELTVADVVRTGATGTIGLFAGRLTADDRNRVSARLRTMGIAHLADRRFTVCSHGERTRTLIARALVARPRLLLLDEPGSGLDLEGRETLLAALDRVVADEPGLTVVLTTHHLEELPQATTHALLLRAGRIVSAGPADETLTAGSLGACFGLEVQVTRSEGRWHATAAPADVR